MTKSFVESLDINDVSQEQAGTETIFIYFKISKVQYNFVLYLNTSGAYYPQGVYHEEYEKNSGLPVCELCDQTSVYCECLVNFMDELFERLITFHSIRLQWLYLSRCKN